MTCVTNLSYNFPFVETATACPGGGVCDYHYDVGVNFGDGDMVG